MCTHRQSRLDSKEAQSCNGSQFPLTEDTWLACQLWTETKQLLHLRVDEKWLQLAYVATKLGELYSVFNSIKCTVPHIGTRPDSGLKIITFSMYDNARTLSHGAVGRLARAVARPLRVQEKNLCDPQRRSIFRWETDPSKMFGPRPR